MLSEAQFGKESNSMPLSEKFDGPSSLKVPSGENSFAANSDMPLHYPGFGKD